MIEFRKVNKSFTDKVVLRDLTFQVAPGEIVFVLGRSGVGKSVLLKHIVGLLRPDSGEIWVDGREISGLSEEAFFPIRRLCGMVFQFPALLDALSVFENVAFGLRAHRLCRPEEEEEVVTHLLAQVHLGPEVARRFPPELSFGMQKRVSVARTLAIQPRYLLFDEPTTSLDPVTTHAIHALIRQLARQLGVTALVVSHDIAGALSVADRILFIDGGRIVSQGSPAELESGATGIARAFLDEAKGRDR